MSLIHPKSILSGSLFFLMYMGAVLIGAAPSRAQTTPTNIQVTNAVQQSSVTRLGVNLNGQTYWDSGQMMKNLVFANPGFEAMKYRSIMICHAATANTCTDDNNYSPQPTGYWTGGTYSVLSGASAGLSGTVVSSTKNPTSCSGCGQIIQFDQNVNMAVGDYFVLTNSFPGNGDAGWWESFGGGGTVATETDDLSPNTAGKQALIMNAGVTGQSVTMTQYFDNESGLSFIQLNGNFEVTFRAKGAGGNNVLNVSVQRLMPSGIGNYLNQKVTLSNTWQDYKLTFSASENGSASGTVQLVFNASGATVKLDDVSLDQTNSSPSNPTAFRDEVVNTLKELNPGTIRMMAAGAALGSDIPNQLQVPGARYRMGFSTGSTTSSGIAYGIHEFLQLCQTVGADPWITIPTATTPAEMTDFIQYLTGTGSDSWSALRIARGQSAPWTSVFNKIHIELGNETWNGSFRGESINYYGYPTVANRIFGVARNTPGYQVSKFDLVLDGMSASPGYNSVLLKTSTQQDSLSIAPYLLYSGNDEPFPTMYGALLAEPELFEGPTGQVYKDLAAVQTAPTPTYLNVYETNLGTMTGGITQAELLTMSPSLGVGLAHADHMLQMMRLGVRYQNAFSLPQYDFKRSDGKLARMWGMVVDMGTTERRRPTFQAQALANSVIGGTMLQTVQTGANPTWDQPLSSDGVQMNGVHDIQSFAFQNGNTISTVLFNLSQTSALPITFSGANAPSGSVQMTQLTSANITDNNETASVVQPVSQVLSGFSAANGLSLPPFSMTVLSWSASVAQTPVFSVAPGTYTSAQTVSLTDGTAGATIYYTTNGSMPTTASTKYVGAFTVASSQTVQAIAVAANYTNSAVASAAYTINLPAAAPSFSVVAGTYTSVQTVSLADATAGAVIYYTTNGSVPTTASAVYSGPITVGSTQTINAIALATNYSSSAVASAAYTINLPAATPSFSVAPGTYTSAQTVSLADATAGAVIYYTTNGSVPTTASAVYSGPITVGSTQTINAIALATNYSSSAVASAAYTINLPAATPSFSVAPGTYTSAQTVSLADATAGAVIYYTTNGSVPTTASAVYSGPISVGSTQTINAIALATNYSSSAVASAAYTINLPAATPVFSVAPGTYTSVQTVSIADATAGATIYYTTNGSVPTSASAVYSGPISVGSTQTINAIALATNYSSSAVASAAYTINLPAAMPSFSVAPGTYTSVQTVSLADATAGAVIYYTTDGSVPTASSTLYTGAITVSATETVQAVVYAPNCTPSAVSAAQYTITKPAVIALGNGFAASKLSMNGSAALSGSMLQLTNGGKAQAGSAWYGTQVSVASFTTDFDFQLPTSNADGFTFTLQNSSKKGWAMGGNGSGLGYQFISNSVTVSFDLFESSVSNAQLLGMYTGGVAPQGNSVDLNTTALNLHSGDPFHVHMVYSGKTLTVTVADKTTGAMFTKSFTVDIAGTIGSSTAYIGFTASTGSATAIQNILNWTYTN